MSQTWDDLQRYPIDADLSREVLNADYIRISREPHDTENVELEFLRIGDRQGRIIDVEPERVRDKLRELGYTMTARFEETLDHAWNFYHAVYVPSEDRLIP